MKAYIYKITCITNLHVGNGEANFDIIDNTVEKDPVTGLPTINSSGVKGALRQHFKNLGTDKDSMTKMFGSDPKDSNTPNEQGEREGSKPGTLKFYQADMLARPVRASKGTETYYMATSLDGIELYNQKAVIFSAPVIDTNNMNGNLAYADNIGIEVDNIDLKKFDFKEDIKKLISGKLVVLQRSVLKDIPLPVIARNQLEDGTSKNLWYEEVVPHKSIFTFAVSADDDKTLNEFDKCLIPEGSPFSAVQFGGNASIGYGLCRVERIGGTK